MIKKFLPVLVLISLLVVLLSPIAASAQITEAPATCKLGNYDFGDLEGCSSGATVEIEKYGMCCLLNTIYNVTNWIFVILCGVVTIFVILGAFTIVTAGGSPEKIKSGRDYILYAAIGLLVAFLAKAIPGVVKILAGIA
jgi:hypothetical protein